MALFKIKKGLKANLPKTYNEGYCYFTTDDGKMYIDTSNASSGRVCLNAAKADQLATARTITLSGDASGSVSFDGSKNVTLTVDIEELDNIKEAIDTKQAIITGAATTITSSNLTANRALISNSSGKVVVSAVTSTELGYLDGVTSNIQTQLNNHTHNYAGSSSAGGAATSANKLNTDAGSATQPVYFSNGIPVKTTYTLGASVPSNAKFTDTVYTLPAAGSSLGGVKSGGDVTISDGVITVNDSSHNHSASNITSGTIAAARLPAASATQAGITVVWPAASCTSFSSDSGTVTPLAVQKGAKMFAITRPTSSTNKAITRYSNTTGDVQDSKIIIEDVTNTRDSSKKAQVIAIPAEGGKKMVYGYCTDQVDGTSFIGGVFDADATEYPYNQGLAISGTSGNLLWKGVKVATTSDIPSVGNGTVTIKQNGTSKGSFTLNQSGNATIELTDTDTNTTYSAATQSAAGLMSAADKKKLDGIATGANNYTYTLPSATSSVLGGVKVGSNITVSSGTISLTKNNVTSALGYTPPTTNTTYSVVSTTADGLAPKRDGSTTKFLRGDGTWATPANTKNTAGSTNTSSKIFLIGATSQEANPQTYSHDTAFVDTDGCLYSNSTKVSLVGHTHTLTPSNTSIYQITGVGTMFTATVSGEVLTLTAGSVPTRSSVSVMTGISIAASAT